MAVALPGARIRANGKSALIARVPERRTGTDVQHAGLVAGFSAWRCSKPVQIRDAVLRNLQVPGQAYDD